MADAAVSHIPSLGLINGQLDTQHIQNWREQGFTLVHDLLPDSLLRSLKQDALDFFPAPNTPESERFKDFSSSESFVFPANSAAFNTVTLHPALLNATAELLGVSTLELRLTQSDLWPKYGAGTTDDPEDNRDQRIHCDYPNHSLLHPPPWSSPEAVEIIIYLDDCEACEGATALVPRHGPNDPAYRWPIIDTPGVGALDYINDREKAESYMEQENPKAAVFRADNLYSRELVAEYQFGSVLFYRHDTWHRGTPVKQNAIRLVQNLTFTKTGLDWLNVMHAGWSWSMYRPDKLMEELIAKASVEQRSVLGFPPPGHGYWTQQTIAAVEARYRAFGIDMSAYKEAL